MTRFAGLFLIMLATCFVGACGDEPTPERNTSGDVGSSSGTPSERIVSSAAPAPASAIREEVPTPHSEPEQTMRLLIHSFRHLTKLLGRVTDEATATAAAPELRTAVEEVRGLVELADSYPPEARAEVHPRFAEILTAETMTFDRELGRILQTPGAAPPLYKILELLIPVRKKSQ